MVELKKGGVKEEKIIQVDIDVMGKQRLSRKKWSSSRSFKLRSGSLNSLRLRRVFDLFDKNGDGLISMDEIRQALVLLGLDEDGDEDEELNSIVTSFIKPGYEGLAFEDFQSLHNSLNNAIFYDIDSSSATSLDPHDEDHDPQQQQQHQQQQHQHQHQHQHQQVESDLTEAFKVFDSNGDGYISATELQQVLSKLGFPEAQQELHHIQLMISSFDQNHDGRVDFFEFKHMMSRILLFPS
ncbi:hypothetical protein BVRB_7g156540 [Beta vulgaris subsp. vulgaris]|nr:hypothetical protein BVRB_7g156540 [Beta vulgaris subsp. vulgaris]